MSDKGWIKLHRQIQDCSIWLDEQAFDYRSAWIDLLLLANHRDKEIIFNSKPMTIHRGQYLTSVRKLSERWGWDKNKTLKYLRLLEELKMISKSSDNKRTLLTIEKYEVYQGCEDTTTDTTSYTTTDTTSYTTMPQTRIKELKNERIINNNKPIRHKYGQYNNVLLTDDEYAKLQEEFADYQDRIERLSEYIASTGKSYKSHLATIRNWARRDKPKKEEPHLTQEEVEDDLRRIFGDF